MTDSLFSSFLMVDGPAGERGALKEGDPAPPLEQGARELFVTAFLHAMKEAAPGEAVPKIGTPNGLEHFAVAVADVALGRSVMLQLKRGLAEGHRDAVRTFLEAVVRVSATLDESRLESAIGKLADVFLPDELAEARGALAADNLELRDRFVAQVPQLTSSDVGSRAGLQTRNPYATAARWKKSGDIFCVQHRGREYFPAFQFREGRPHPTVKKVLAALPPRLSSWQRALWFVSTNGWLGNRAPVDVLDDVQAVVASAKHENEDVVG